MKKRILAALLSVTLLAGVLAGCGDKPADTTSGTTGTDDTSKTESTATPSGDPVKLTVWGPEDETVMLKEMVEEFKTANPDKTYDITVAVVGEPDLRTKYGEDPEAAADVFMFPGDQLKELVNSSSLYPVTRNKEDVIARNVPGSIDAATIDNELYAYPMTADNGYFMYYDKSVISEEDVKSLDGILAAANKAGKKVFMDVSNGWYIASFFLGAGGNLGVDEAGKQTVDFNNEDGVKAGEAIKAFTADKAFITGDDTILTGGAKAGEIAAGISGVWTAESFKEAYGDNYAATKLPTFTCGSEQKQMKSFGGFKFVGVNSLTKSPEDAMDLADFLTSEANQVKRYTVRSLGPSNIKAADNAEIKADIALSALSAQSAFAYPEKDVTGGYWTPAEAFGTAMENKDYSKDVKALLDEMVAQIQAAG